MRKKNPFKIETERLRTPMARREQKWAWLRKMKKLHGVDKKGFIEAAYGINLFTLKVKITK